MNRRDKSGPGRGGRKRKNTDGNTPKKTNKKKAKCRAAAANEDESRSDIETENSSQELRSADDTEEIFEARFSENDDIVTMGVNEDEERTLNESIQQESSDEEDGEIIFNSSQESQTTEIEESTNNNATTARRVLNPGNLMAPIEKTSKNAVSKINKRAIATVAKEAAGSSGCRKVTDGQGPFQSGGANCGNENVVDSQDTGATQQLINDTIQRTMEQLFAEGRLKMEETAKRNKETFRYKSPLCREGKQLINSNSDLTIYERAVADQVRTSSSSEEGVNTSDEFDNRNEIIDNCILADHSHLNKPADVMVEVTVVTEKELGPPEKSNQVDFIDSMIKQISEATRGRTATATRGHDYDVPQPSTSRGEPSANRGREQRTPEDVADQLIKQAELSKAQVYETPGKQNDDDGIFDLTKQFVHSAMVDENYKIVGAHVDSSTRARIVSHEYIDFGKLIPKDRVMVEEDQKIQWVIRQGMPCCVPQVESTGINNYAKWEQAFRVYSAIYTEAHPHKAGELIQYNHIIHTAAQAYIWDNVYMYDKDFRIHISQFPLRSWDSSFLGTCGSPKKFGKEVKGFHNIIIPTMIEIEGIQAAQVGMNVDDSTEENVHLGLDASTSTDVHTVKNSDMDITVVERLIMRTDRIILIPRLGRVITMPEKEISLLKHPNLSTTT